MKSSVLAAFILLVMSGAASAQGMDIKVKSGAVGLDERNAMMAERGLYNLQLAFARTGGAFLADVKVTIRDRKGSVVYEGNSDGPLFFANLPKGGYDVTASFEGKAQTRKVEVGAAPRELMYFRWS